MKNKKQKSARRLAREYAVQALYQWQLSENEADELLLQFESDNDFTGVDKDYWRELIRQSIRSVAKIDEDMQPFLTRKISGINPVELAVLRLSIYELSARPEIPYRVVINEALELVKLFGALESYRFINGVLDAASKKLRMVEAGMPASKGDNF